MAERLQGRRVIVVDPDEFRTLLQALDYTATHENRGLVGPRARKLHQDLLTKSA